MVFAIIGIPVGALLMALVLGSRRKGAGTSLSIGH
jgi:hypothetical protein